MLRFCHVLCRRLEGAVHLGCGAPCHRFSARSSVRQHHCAAPMPVMPRPPCSPQVRALHSPLFIPAAAPQHAHVLHKCILFASRSMRVTGELDERSMHGACPVVAGEKWSM